MLQREDGARLKTTSAVRQGVPPWRTFRKTGPLIIPFLLPMQLPFHSSERLRKGFSLVEALLTIAIMGVLTSLVVSVVSTATQDASRMVARQQQAAVQSAVQAWASSQTRDPGTGQIVSQESIRADYNSRSTSLARLNLVAGYLDNVTANHFLTTTTNSSAIESDALNTASQHLELPNWDQSSYPQVNLVNN